MTVSPLNRDLTPLPVFLFLFYVLPFRLAFRSTSFPLPRNCFYLSTPSSPFSFPKPTPRPLLSCCLCSSSFEFHFDTFDALISCAFLWIVFHTPPCRLIYLCYIHLQLSCCAHRSIVVCSSCVSVSPPLSAPRCPYRRSSRISR